MDDIDRQFEVWFSSRAINYSAVSGQHEAFRAGYEAGKSDAILTFLTQEAESEGDYDV